MKHWLISVRVKKKILSLILLARKRRGWVGSPSAGVADRRRGCGWRWCARATRTGAWRRTTSSGSWGLRPGPARPADAGRPAVPTADRPVLGGSGSRPVLCGGGRGSRPRFSLTRAGQPRFPGGRCAAAPEGRPRGLAASRLVGYRAERSEESTKLGPPRGPPRVLSVAKNSHSEPKCFRVAETSKLLVNLKGWCCSHLLRTHVCVSENHGLCKMLSSEAVSCKMKVRVHERIGRLCPGRVAFLSNMENLRDRISG